MAEVFQEGLNFGPTLPIGLLLDVRYSLELKFLPAVLDPQWQIWPAGKRLKC